MGCICLFWIYCAVLLHHLSASLEKKNLFYIDIFRKPPLTRYSYFLVEILDLCHCKCYFPQLRDLQFILFCSSLIHIGLTSIIFILTYYILPYTQVCWKDVIHWMWPLFTENWGSWRYDDLNLSAWPFTVYACPFFGLYGLTTIIFSPHE